MKAAVLRLYELRPEAYRQRIRSCRKQADETYWDFCRNLSDEFRVWMRNNKVYGNFDNLEQLAILEDFLKKVDMGVRTSAEASV